MTEGNWTSLLENIEFEQWLPVIGAGACFGTLPLGGELSRALAEKYRYPLDNPGDLARVSQYVELVKGTKKAKREVASLVGGVAMPTDQEPHRILASLPCTCYLTTNYDHFMEDSLVAARRQPQVEVSRWNRLLDRLPNPFPPSFRASTATPVVFHFHGVYENLDSLVLTENDYYDFLIAIASNPRAVHPIVGAALQQYAPVFIGYGLADVTFRVLFRSLMSLIPQGFSMDGVVVQPPAPSEEARTYLEMYYAKMNLAVYWGTAKAFASELKERHLRYLEERNA